MVCTGIIARQSTMDIEPTRWHLDRDMSVIWSVSFYSKSGTLTEILGLPVCFRLSSSCLSASSVSCQLNTTQVASHFPSGSIRAKLLRPRCSPTYFLLASNTWPRRGPAGSQFRCIRQGLPCAAIIQVGCGVDQWILVKAAAKLMRQGWTKLVAGSPGPR